MTFVNLQGNITFRVPSPSPNYDQGWASQLVRALDQQFFQIRNALNLISLVDTVNLPPSTAPANPASGWVIYCDTSDGKLKAKASTGTIVVLGTP